MSDMGRLMNDLVKALEEGEIQGEKLIIDLDDAIGLYSTMYGMGCELTKRELLYDDYFEDEDEDFEPPTVNNEVI
ncbi:MAG: hypothetical protein ACW99U_20235 [Candidatus Thorarchaeota archaeon]